MATTAEDIQNNITALNKRIQTEGITDSSGRTLLAPTIPVSTLAGQGAVTIPEQTDPNASSYPGVISSGASMTAPKEEGGIDPALQSYLDSITAPPSTADAYNEAYNQSGKEAAAKQVADITAELNAITAEGQQANLKLEQDAGGKDVTTSFLGKQQQEVNRQVAIKSLPVQARLAAAQGNLNLATEKLNTLFKLKSDDATNKYNYKIKIADIFYKFATDKQKEQLDAQKTKDANAFTLKINDINNAQTLSNAILKYDPETASKISAIDWDSPTAKAEFTKLQSQIKTPPDTQIVKLDNGNSILIDSQTGKIISNLGGAKPTSSGLTGKDSVFGSLIGTTSNLETTVSGKKDVAEQLSNYLENEDYESAYNQIANTVENSLPGETKTRFANARIDREVLAGFKNSIEKYRASGGEMGLLKGTAEEILRKLGQVNDPKLTEIAVQLQREFQTYRNTMTGAAFTPAESKEYASVNPTSNKSLDLNLAVIEGAINQLNNRVDGTIRAKVPQATDLLKVINVPKTAEEAKSKVNEIWQGYPDLHQTIESLFSSGKYDDFAVLEYLKVKNLIQ